MALPFDFAGRFRFDYTDSQPGIQLGYFFQVRVRGHEHCGCMRGRARNLIFLHNPALGEFPMHFSVSDFLIASFVRDYNLEILEGCWSGSYGYISQTQLGNRFQQS